MPKCWRPLLKNVELSGALRADHFTDVGNSYTPRVGVKWTPLRELALRGTFAKGFRAPSAAENGVGGLAAFPPPATRCAARWAWRSRATRPPSPSSPRPIPKLSPERSRSYSVGAVWDPLPHTSLSVDLWQIRRKNEINQEQTDTAIAQGHVARDPSTASDKPGDPGAITAVLASYVNSAQTTVRGIDIDARQRFNLGGDHGNLVFDLKWTHLYKWLRTEQDGTQRDFAGTHGNSTSPTAWARPVTGST